MTNRDPRGEPKCFPRRSRGIIVQDDVTEVEPGMNVVDDGASATMGSF